MAAVAGRRRLALGATLVALAVFLAWWPVGPRPQTWGRPGYHHPIDPPLASPDDPRLARRPGESDRAFAERATQAIFRAHWNCDDAKMRQSWLATALRRVGQLPWKPHGNLSLEAHRCGLCHQTAYLLSRVLRREGIPARPWGIGGHVVTRATLDGRDVALDADIGVGPLELAEPGLEARAFAAYRIVDDDYGRHVAALYASAGDNRDYYDNDELDRVAAQQARLLRWQRPLELALGAAGLALAGAGLLAARRR